MESLCFYWGCPNVSDYIHPHAYVQLDLNDFEKSFQIIKNALQENLWEKRLHIIRAEKQKVLEYYNFFPTLERIIFENPVNYLSFIQGNVKNICFIHSCNLGDLTNLENLISRIKDTGLLQNLDYLIINNIGAPIYKNYGDEIHIINYSENTKLFEIPTIKLISEFSQTYENVNLLYLNTKGVSYKENKNVSAWTHFMLDKYAECMYKLKEYDAVGCNYLKEPSPHFSGNFWWAKTDYLRTIPTNKLKEKHDAERWILSNTPKFSYYT